MDFSFKVFIYCYPTKLVLKIQSVVFKYQWIVNWLVFKIKTKDILSYRVSQMQNSSCDIYLPAKGLGKHSSQHVSVS